MYWLEFLLAWPIAPLPPEFWGACGMPETRSPVGEAMVAPPPRLEPFPTCGDTYDPAAAPADPAKTHRRH